MAGRAPWPRGKKAGFWAVCAGSVVGLIWLTSQPRQEPVRTDRPVAADRVGEVGDAWSPIRPAIPAQPAQPVQPVTLTVPPPPSQTDSFLRLPNGPLAAARVPIAAFQAPVPQTPPRTTGQPEPSAGGGGDALDQRPRQGADQDTSVTTLLPDRNLFITMGTPMPCLIEQPVNTDVPGPFRCKVTQPVYSTSGAVRLLDPGTWMVGDVSESLKRGNRRAFAVIRRIETPQGCIVRLRAPVGDAMGEAGLDGEISQHFWQRFRGHAMIALLDTASQAAALAAAKTISGNNGISFNQFQGMGQNMGQGFADDATVPPTLYRPQGGPAVVMPLQDLDFRQCYQLRTR